MARSLENKINVIAPDTDYPFGRIRDNDGTGNGVPVNETVYGDFHQFFAKMFNFSGGVYNELPDNDYSGFQYFEALVETIRLKILAQYEVAQTWVRTTVSNGVAVTASSAISYTGLTTYFSYFIRNKVCHLDFDIHLTITSGATVDYIRIPLPENVVKTITGLDARYTTKGAAWFIAPTGTTDFVSCYINGSDDTLDGQYLQIKRASEGDTITWSAVATILKGHIEFQVD